METINNAAKSVSEGAQQLVSGGKQEAGKQQAQNSDTVGGTLEGAKDYVVGGAEKEAHGAKSDSANPLK